MARDNADQVIAVMDAAGDQLQDALTAVSEKMGIAIDWTQTNIVPYLVQLAHRIVAYEFWTSFAWIVFFGIPFFGILIWGSRRKKALKALNDETEYFWDEDRIDPWVYVIGGIITGICFAIAFVMQGLDMVTCLTFPEKVIYDFITPYLTSR